MRETISRYLRGEVPLQRVFWHDMLLVGTMINIVLGAVALIVYLNDGPGWLAFLIFMSPLPYNFFLTIAVWRAAARSSPSSANLARLGAILWLGFFIVL